MMFDPDPRRGGWSGRRPWMAGICASLATEFDLPPALVRIIAVVFMVLPTGLTYLALAWLASQRRGQPDYALSGRPLSGRSMSGRSMSGQSMSGRSSPWGPMPRASSAAGASVTGREALALQQRFASLEARLKPMEAFVSSKDFELHKGFRHMRG